MERAKPVRTPHTSTSDLLTWSEAQPLEDSSAYSSRSTARPNQVFGGQITGVESECPSRRKTCSDNKLKEMGGNQIFAADNEDGSAECGLLMQAARGMSQLSFGIEENVNPKKLSTLSEMARHREMSRTLETEADSRMGIHFSDAKNKELGGSDIFSRRLEIPPHSSATEQIVELTEDKDMGETSSKIPHISVRVSSPTGGQSSISLGDEPLLEDTREIRSQTFAEQSGKDIFKGNVPPGYSQKASSSAKLKEMGGNDIFGDGKVEYRDHFGGARRPPGGESTISLV